MKKQADAGVDLINDGELSKPSYATYVKDRLAGFGGTGNTFVYQDLADFPKLQQKVFGDPGRSRRKTPACNAPISVRDPQAALTDVDNLKAALGARAGEGRLHERGLARRGGGVLPQRPLSERGGLSLRHRGCDAARIRGGGASAGFVLQIDCPDLAMGRHIKYSRRRPEDLPQGRAAQHRGDEPRGRQHPARAAAHPCVLGQLRGPASLRCAARRHDRSRVHGARRAPSRSRPRTRATRTNGRCSRR